MEPDLANPCSGFPGGDMEAPDSLPDSVPDTNRVYHGLNLTPEHKTYIDILIKADRYSLTHLLTLFLYYNYQELFVLTQIVCRLHLYCLHLLTLSL